MLNEIINKNETLKIEDKIYNIRGFQVMLDSDIAELFGVETKRLNEQMKRNIGKFPEDFCFQLSKDEINDVCSRFQIGTLNKNCGTSFKDLGHKITSINKIEDKEYLRMIIDEIKPCL